MIPRSVLSAIRSTQRDIAVALVLALALYGAVDLVAKAGGLRALGFGPTASVEAKEQYRAYLPRLESGERSLEDRIARLEKLLEDVRRTEDELIVSGVNLRVVNGQEFTDSEPNGLGNVIIGYNESRGEGLDERSGSHMLVVGTRNNWTGYGGVVVGRDNSAHGEYTVVLGGKENVAEGFTTTICGGFGGHVAGEVATVTGGFRNEATGDFSVVGGGRERTAENPFNWAAGSLLEDR